MEKLKIIFIGDGGIGKTTLLFTYDEKKLLGEYIPTVFDTFSKKFQIEENQEIEISFWDMARFDYDDRLLPLYFPQTDVIVFCFAIDRYASFENIESVWIPEIGKYIPKYSKRILVGTKMDLRNNQKRINELKERNEKFVTKEEGIELAKKINAIKYFECSSFNQKGIETIFNEIALICVGKYDKEERKKGCILN
ncbi:ras-related c3 botulinum toxin substrate [Anaeramoeba ignava]|uniref:Ras-related c3 botulinum toxin substrate n=1 Tax=Anaeramoeba ignava TaxID=1746090 RepID=A0A9Q0LSB8_ANAIG|nr:ras-related c3 botulinum toxin substrate [Anaeramoeba ignava]